MPAPRTLDAIRTAPKVLLHDHLDGGLRVATILELSDQIGWTPNLPTTDPVALQRWFTAGAEAKDLLLYLATFEHTGAVMQSEANLERVAYEAVLDLANDGVVYAEVRFAPELHGMHGLDLEAVIEAVQAGFARGMRDTQNRIVVNTIICAMRTAQRSLEISKLAVRMRERDARIVAFDIAGAETGWPPSQHAKAFAYARANQMHITIHASEPPDLELIDDALRQGAERIGHGVRLQADVNFATGKLGQLATYVLERQITLEMAPTCNMQIGAVPSIADHPIGRFLRMGFRVGVNTDNRLMSNVAMSTEVHAVAEAFDLSWDEIGRLALNSLDGSFSNWNERQHLRNTIVAPAYAALANAV
jgi:adenosine deaminase